MITELKKGVYWVGVVDWGLRHFHGHELSTHRGSTYNSYLIIDEKIVLVDTVWGPFQDELIAKYQADHRSSQDRYRRRQPCRDGPFRRARRRLAPLPRTQLLSSRRRGEESIEGHYHQPWNFRQVKTGDKINIGKNDLVFVEAPMLHWPDSMFTYLTGQNILMSNDAFGQHYATAFRFNDQVDHEELYEEALKYYANILTPFSALVIKKIDEVLALNLPVDMIAPSHGVIWRSEPLQIVNKYQRVGRPGPEQERRDPV